MAEVSSEAALRDGVGPGQPGWRLETEAAFRRQGVLLESLLDATGLGFLQIDAAGKVAAASGRACEILGRSRDGLIGLRPADLAHPDEREETRKQLAGLRRGEAQLNVEKRYLRPDGSIVWTSTNATAAFSADGSFLGAVALLTEITDRKLLEEARREDEERYRSLIESIDVALYTTDAEGRLLLFNDAAVELWGRRPTVGVDYWCGSFRIFTPEGESIPLDQCPMAIALKENRPVRGVDIVVERPDGSRAHVLPHPTPLRSPDGRLVGAVNVLADVTELKRAEADAYRLSAIVESADDAIVSKDLNGTIQSWNAGAERLFGYGAEEAIGRSIRMIIPSDRQAEEDDILLRIRRGERLDHFETVRQRKDGSLVPISLTISPIKDRSGRVIGASKIARDISKWKEAERALEEALRLKDQFFGLVSHELRTPLSTIYGDSHLLRDRFDRIPDDDRRVLLDDLVSEAERLQRIIENLLLLTRLEVTPIELEPTLLPALVQRVVRSFQARHPRREITLEAEASAAPVLSNPVYIEMVLENLLSNAAKYSGQETPIAVIVRQAREGAEVLVRDAGMGLTPDDIERLFTPFYRSARARGFTTGVGVGLAVCKRVIEAQGGRIWARPNAGPGAEFGFSLKWAPHPGFAV